VIDLPPERRSKLEQYFEVIQAIKTGNSGATDIMREVNVSYRSVNEMLDSLQKQDIIEVKDDKNFKDKRNSVYYKLTRKGDNIYRYLSKALSASV